MINFKSSYRSSTKNTLDWKGKLSERNLDKTSQ